MTDKMREEFERTNGRDHRRQPPKGNSYIDPMAQADWESFQKGWSQSHSALLKQQAKEQEEFLAHLADFEPEDTLHD
jgi:hypothetical protein